ncbi:ATP-binding cassette domain-containing protein [Agrobacterium sp. rho-13.3]|uniref:ATP-binding cassette domain-containing protein n=1 Tax=Agrobacterium sp. rho-13.3 TaxID=3072980 RepID=UPI0039B76F58
MVCGCGKSTVLRFLTGLDRPDSGGFTLNNGLIDRPSLKRGMVFRDHRLLPWFSVEKTPRSVFTAYWAPRWKSVSE